MRRGTYYKTHVRPYAPTILKAAKATGKVAFAIWLACVGIAIIISMVAG